MRDTRIPYWLVIKRYWVNLMAISLTWFIYDFITYVYSLTRQHGTDGLIWQLTGIL